MISLEDALAAYTDTVRPLPAVEIPTLDACGYVLADAARAATDLPRFDQSALDGYCFASRDVADARDAAPVRLPIVQTIAASGHAAQPSLAAGTAARIFTGAMLPTGADAMQAQERAQRDGDTLVFTKSFPAGRNIRRQAEELAKGTVLAEAGSRIGPGLLASLVNAEVATVRVHRRPQVRVFVTGDEVRPAGATLLPGEIHDSNGPLITALLRAQGIDVPPPVHLGDDPVQVRAALEQAFAEADLVISAGGASVGDKDFLPAAAESLGLRRVFWKVAQKPAKPMFFGLREDADGQKLMLALPGNPGAVLIGMVLHVRRVLDQLVGLARPDLGWTTGVLEHAVERDDERARLVRMRLRHDEQGVARLNPLPKQDSHMLSNLGRADVLVWVEAGTGEVAAGTPLRWLALPE
ncbi:gephyrin-like molybdotransferase Glp [Nevskia sp.]|uniref:molybdopterin molybdotransferase MoeA n=1 Tax=Nevskia sp. TaxID=1929292 RepID=UPI0025D01128|nr:gephyrin-like molybdotransferase Glp [Nevskia sp.]